MRGPDNQKKGGKNLPAILDERVKIDDSDRELLNILDDMSPKNNSVIYVAPSISNMQVPSLNQISEKLGKPKKEVWSQLNKIRKIWNVPKASSLPMNRGFFDEKDALVNALTNQHRLRWDEAREDYRVPKFHLMSAEMGFGTLHTNNDAFRGENIFRKAIGLDEKLNSVHIQGGVMPEMIQIFGKAKNQRALMTGLNKTGEEANMDELEKIKQTLNLADHKLTDKDLGNLNDYVVNTLGSLPEAAKSVAHEMLPLVENLPEHTPVHMYWSYNDAANMSEIEDTLNASLRKIHSRMKSATKKLPDWRDEKEALRSDLGSSLIDKLVLERVYYHVNKERSKAGDEFSDRGADFGNLVDSYFHNKRTGADKADFKRLKEKVKVEYQEITGKAIRNRAAEEQFDSEFFGVVNRIYDEHITFGNLKKAHEKEQEGYKKTYRQLSSLEDKIEEAERFENSLMAEGEGPAWFTGHIAITPMEAKTLQMVKKQQYKEIYTDILIPELKKLSGKDLNIKLHTDSIITVDVPDPQDLIEGVERTDDSPVGTLFTSMPRTNEQRSNEPLLNSAAELQGFHMGMIAERAQKGKAKAKTVGEFNKRDFASSDVYMTSWGSDGFNHQAKFAIGPTTIKNEMREDPEITQYMKLTTRHDTSKLGELMVKGNKGTWAAKRLAKGGGTTGNVLYIEHADQSFQPMFIDDLFYENIAEQHGEKYSELEAKLNEAQGKLGRARSAESKKTLRKTISSAKAEIEKIHEAVKPQLYNVLLQNDLHFGAYTTPGRPSVTDCIQGSQLAAIQAFGLDDMHYSIITEAFNGEQAWRSYDSKREGGQGSKKSNIEMLRDFDMIHSKLEAEGFSEGDIIRHLRANFKESLESRPEFLPETQIDLFKQVLQPVNEELMDHGMKLWVGSGNHWMASKYGNINEGNVITNLFDSKYLDQGNLILGRECSGQSYSYETIRLPSVDGQGIPAVATHKLPTGKTEISAIAKHLVGTRTPAKYCFTADRHQPGIVAERGKMAILDVGKQPVVPFVDMIGKVSGIRGTMIGQYGAAGENIIGARYFADPVTEKVIGWQDNVGVLRVCKSVLEEAVRDTALVTEMRNNNYMAKNNKNDKKFDGLEKYIK